MKRAWYYSAIKSIFLSAMLAFSSLTFAAAIKDSSTVKANSTKAAPTKVTKNSLSWLFVLQAKKGTITKTDKKGVYLMTIQRSDMDPIVAFTDRPDRIVKKITPKQLQEIWSKGPNSFKSDPPNAVLSARGLKAQIVEVTALAEDGAYQIRFSPHAGGAHLIGKFEELVMVVDSKWINVLSGFVQYCFYDDNCPG